MNTYLVTGGSGFIGSHLCDVLIEKGANVINVDNFNDYYDPEIKKKNIAHNLNKKNYRLEKIDIRDYGDLDRIFGETKVDTVVHLAAMAGVRPSIEKPLLYQDVNVKGTMNMMEMCGKYKVKNLICASSSSVYGNNETVPFKETDVVDFTISPYAATKKSCEVMGHTYHHLYDIDMAMLRFFTVYGPRQRPDLAIHKFTKFISDGKEIPFYGDGSTKRDYTYIDDIVEGILKSINYVEKNSKVYEIFNLGESQTVSLYEMLSSIEKELKLKAKIKNLPMQPGDVEKTFADISKAKRMLGYNPRTEFRSGIKKFIRWYKSNKKN